jgi:hypothetical protein
MPQLQPVGLTNRKPLGCMSLHVQIMRGAGLNYCITSQAVAQAQRHLTQISGSCWNHQLLQYGPVLTNHIKHRNVGIQCKLLLCREITHPELQTLRQ